MFLWWPFIKFIQAMLVREKSEQKVVEQVLLKTSKIFSSETPGQSTRLFHRNVPLINFYHIHLSYIGLKGKMANRGWGLFSLFEYQIF